MGRFEQLAVHLLPKIAADDRAYVALLLANRSDAPASVARMLARDAIEIATPMLRHSPVLSTIDLLGVIAVTGPEHHRLVAGRTDLSTDILRALAIAKRKEAAVKNRNRAAAYGAIAGPTPAEKADTVSAAPPGPRMPIPDFGAFLDSLREHRLWLLGEAAMRGAGTPEASQIRQLDQMLRKSYALAEIVTSAKRGDRLNMLGGFSSALGVATKIVARLLDDPSGEPLVLMIKAAGLSVADGNTILLLGNKRIGASVDEFFRLADLLASIEPSTATAFIASWRQPALRRRPIHVPVFTENGEGWLITATTDRQSTALGKRVLEG